MLETISLVQKTEDLKVDSLAFAVFEGKIEKGSSLEKVDTHLAGLIAESIRLEKWSGKLGEIKVLHTHYKLKARYVILVGAGEMKKFNAESLRKMAAKLNTACKSLKVKSLAFALQEATSQVLDPRVAAEACAEAFFLSAYQFTEYKSNSEDVSSLSEVFFLAKSSAVDLAFQKGIQLGKILSLATNEARDLINTPSLDKPPEFLASQAKKIKGLSTKVFYYSDLKKMKMGALCGVGQGSKNPPVLIEMHYKPKVKAKHKIALVGKGVTFDSGGLSLKPPKSMETMKEDMSGAAAVMGAMKCVAQIKPNVEVYAYVPAAENMPGGGAIRPGDVLTGYSGKTIEVLNTDAEGRLILSDAISYALTKKPDCIIDIATLTGACLVALGELYSAILCNDTKLRDQLMKAAEESGEKVWELPLVEEYKEEIKSPIADIQNVGGPYGGTINGALFLQEFVGKTSWAHFDIAGPSWANKPYDYFIKGGTGCMVRTLTRFVMGF